MCDVFISYARQDKALREHLERALARTGYTVFWDDLLEPGEFKAELLKKLIAAHVIVVVWTEDSTRSDWVKHEASVGLALSKLVSVRSETLAPSAIPDPYVTQNILTLGNIDRILTDVAFQKNKRAADLSALHAKSRRQFLMGGLTVGAASVMTATLNPSTRKVLVGAISSLVDGVRDLEPDCVTVAKSLLMGTGHNVHVMPSFDNPWSSKSGLTQPTRHACRTLARLFKAPREEIATPDALRQIDYYGNLILLGGPLANRLTRLVMGDSGVSELILPDDGLPALRLPFHFDIPASVAAYDQGEFRQKPDPSDGARRAPIWSIYKQGKMHRRPRIKDHRLVDDALLLTSIPNVLNKDSFENGSRIVILAGAHSAGTRAIHDLLKSRDILESLMTLSQGVTAWQALLTVDEISSDGFPLSLFPQFEFSEIHADFDAIAGVVADDRSRVLSEMGRSS